MPDHLKERPPQPDPSRRYGAYGLHLPHITAHDYLVEAPAHWPTWQLEWSVEPYPRDQRWSADEAELDLQPRGRAQVRRVAAHTTLHLPAAPSQHALLHPYIGVTALAAAAWSGWASLHAGSFLHGGRVWGLLGDRELGKSSALAWLATHDVPVVADDLLITDGTTVLAGPRCIDLRESAMERFGIGESVGVLGTRERWRVQLDPIAAELPFGGWVELAWGEGIGVGALPISERMAQLRRNRALKLPVADTVSGMRLLAAPALRFSRPQRWEQLDEAMAALLAALP